MKRNWLLIVVVGLQFLIAVSPLLPRVQAIWGDKIEPVEVLAVNFGALAVLLPLLLAFELKSTKHAIEALKLDQLRAEMKKAAAFYQDFETAIKDAKDYVDIAYMAAYPPAETADAKRRRYYDELPALMRRREEITFRRIVRASEKNRPWIAKMLKDMKGARNFALAAINDDESKADSLVLSVQIVDGELAWLVALESHEPKGGPRDLHVKGKIVADALRLYYSRIWARAEVLMQAGNPTPEGERYLASISPSASGPVQTAASGTKS